MTRLDGFVVTHIIADEEICFFVVNEHDGIQRHHAKGEFYELEELRLISNFFPKGGVYVDVGANVGNHVIYVCKYLRPIQAILFEPNPPAVSILKLNLMLNGLEKIVDLSYLGIGLSDTKGTALARTVHSDNLGGTRLEIVERADGLPIAPGDEFLLRRRVDFIKIDVEEMEMLVLHGLRGTISKWRPSIFVEVAEKNDTLFHKWIDSVDYYVIDKYRRYSTLLNYMILPIERDSGRLERDP